MKLTFLGTGTSSGVPYIGCDCEVCRSKDPRDKRLRCSSLLEINGKHILIDCGPDFRQQALRANIRALDAVLLTHLHTDHIMGLDETRVYGTTHIYGDETTMNAVQRVFPYCFNNPYKGTPSFELHTIENKPFFLDGVGEVTPIQVYHYQLPIFGYRFGNFAYITDCKTIESQEVEKLRGVEIMVMNALRFTDHFSHATVEEAIELIRQVNPKQAYLVHASHEIGLHATVDAQLPENIHLAYDGLEIEIP